MNHDKLFQFQCVKEGTLFYYQTGLTVRSSRQYVITRCPVCGSTRVLETGRSYPPLNEQKRKRKLRGNGI